MYICLSTLSGVVGGVEMRMALEARVLAREGYVAEIAINLHPALRQWASALHQDGIAVWDFDPSPFMETAWRWRHLNKCRALWNDARMLRAKKPDLFHVYLSWVGFGGTRLWLAHHCHIPSIISVHNNFFTDYSGWSPWEAKHYREAFRSVRAIYAVSQTALKNFFKFFGEFVTPGTVTEVIPNSVNTDRFRPNPAFRVNARHSLGLKQDSLVLGTVGRLAPEKRPGCALALFAQLKSRFPDVYLVFVGEGPLEQELRIEAEKLGVSESVIFAGFYHAVETILPAFDLFLTLSRSEGFGTSTIEALACGLPVLGTDVPGTQDILSQSRGGVVVPLDDPQAALEACVRLLQDQKLRTRLGMAGREDILCQYDERIWESRIVDFYRRALGAQMKKDVGDMEGLSEVKASWHKAAHD